MPGYYSYAGYVGALGIIFSSFFLAVAKVKGLLPSIESNHLFGMVGFAFIVMLFAEFLMQRHFIRKHSLQWEKSSLSADNKHILKSTAVRFVMLLIPFLLFYSLVQNHYYFIKNSDFQPARDLFDILLVLFLVGAFPYIFVTLKYRGAYKYEFNDYAILTFIGIKSLWLHLQNKILQKPMPEYKLYQNRRVKKVLRLYLVNFFFLTLMARFLTGEFHGFEQELSKLLSNEYAQLGWYQQYKIIFLILFHLLFTIDVGIAIIGYTVASRWLFNRTKSVDATLSGWMVALICYPPFNSITTQFFGYYGLPTHNLFTDEKILAIILTIVILLYIVYVWATIALGFKFSNLTNRGIVDRGPYAYVRHPAYAAKNSAWWVDNTFVLTNIWATLALTMWNIIYIMRALTEERHLLHDKAYKVYIKKVKYKFIPKIV